MFLPVVSLLLVGTGNVVSIYIVEIVTDISICIVRSRMKQICDIRKVWRIGSKRYAIVVFKREILQIGAICQTFNFGSLCI